MTRTNFSLEIVPPNEHFSYEEVQQISEQLSKLHPSFIGIPSINKSKMTEMIQLAGDIQKLQTNALPHLPARFMTKKQVQDVLKILQEQEVFQLLAVSGEVMPHDHPTGEFAFANELSHYINEQTNRFTVLGTCHPEHIATNELAQLEMTYLQQKVQNGCQQFLTQLFFENDGFYRLHDKYIKQLTTPLLVGVLPILSYQQVLNMATRNQLAIPRKLAILLDKYQYDPISMRAAGLDYTLYQLDELIHYGVDGVHLFTMNDVPAAVEIYRNFW